MESPRTHWTWPNTQISVGTSHYHCLCNCPTKRTFYRGYATNIAANHCSALSDYYPRNFAVAWPIDNRPSLAIWFAHCVSGVISIILYWSARRQYDPISDYFCADHFLCNDFDFVLISCWFLFYVLVLFSVMHAICFACWLSMKHYWLLLLLLILLHCLRQASFEVVAAAAAVAD